MKWLIFILFFIKSESLLAFQNDWSLRAGVGLSQATVHAFDSSEDNFTGVGFNTQFGYRFKRIEANFASYIYGGKIDDLRFNASGTDVIGSGTFVSASFGPMVKIFSNWQPFSGWYFYGSGGYAYSLQTIKLNNFQLSSGVFDKKYKLTYISRGPMLSIGIEEILPFKEMHPVFIELLYSYNKSKEANIVDTSDFTEVKKIATEESPQKIKENFFMINAGITLF